MRRGISTGSGWIYDADGHIVTNYHVVENAQQIEVQLSSGELREAEMVGYDASTDIAVIRVAPGRLHPAHRGDATEPVQQGDLVFAFGSPFDFRFSMSSGIVSGKGRTVGVIRDQVGRTGYENFIQVDAAINPGNSGGPLTDHRGHVIGMNTAIATGRQSSFNEGQFAGIGLAIPLEMIEPVVSQIIDQGFVEKGFLGVSVDELNVRLAQEFGFIGDGVLIRAVDDGGPADQAGVRPGDIVSHVNDEPVQSVLQLQAAISTMRPGDVAELTIFRPQDGAGETVVVPVELERLDPLRTRGQLPANQPDDRIPALGIAGMTTSTPELAAEWDVPYAPGVFITEVAPNSVLDRQVEPGTTIVGVMGTEVESTDEFIEILRQYDLRGLAGGMRGGVRANVVLPNGEFGAIRLFVEP
jgi:serine protease Do